MFATKKKMQAVVEGHKEALEGAVKETMRNRSAKMQITDGARDAMVLNSAPDVDTGQAGLAVRILSQVGTGTTGEKTPVMRTVTTAGPAGALHYRVPAGKTFYIQYLESSGVACLESPPGVALYMGRQLSLAEPMPFPAGTEIQVLCVEAGTVNFGGYEA